MSLPPLANLFAVHRSDPLKLDAIETDLAAGGEFAQVWRPARGWLAAAAPLPGGEPDSAAVRAGGLAFAEGRDRLHDDDRADPRAWLADVAGLTDRAPDRLALLRGDFGFLRFRPDGSATVVRSCGGLVPFYLWQSGRDTAIATRLGDLVRYLPEPPRVDALINAVWTTGYCLFPDRRTFLAGVTIVERGHAALLRPGRPAALAQYWRPRLGSPPPPTAARAREHAERLRTILIDALRRDLACEDGNLLTLSGGVDSSSLAALATGVVSRPVWTWSLLPGSEDLFQHEMSFIEPLTKRFGIERRWVVRMTSPTTTLDLLRQSPPVVFHVIHPALCALPSVVREAPVRVLFGGEFADEVCGSGGTTPDWAMRTSLFALLAGLRQLPSGPKDILRWAKHRGLEFLGRPVVPFARALPHFVHADIRDEYRSWLERRRREVIEESDGRRQLALCSEAAGYVTMNWEAASALGVRRSFPFFNREMLELAFECHPAELVGPGSKKLLRAALRQDVPSNNLDRRDKGRLIVMSRGCQVPWAAAVPDVLRLIVRDEFFELRDGSLAVSDARALSQLIRFAQAVETRRAERSRALGARREHNTYESQI